MVESVKNHQLNKQKEKDHRIIVCSPRRNSGKKNKNIPAELPVHVCHGQGCRYIGDKLIPPLMTESL